MAMFLALEIYGLWSSGIDAKMVFGRVAAVPSYLVLLPLPLQVNCVVEYSTLQ